MFECWVIEELSSSSNWACSGCIVCQLQVSSACVALCLSHALDLAGLRIRSHPLRPWDKEWETETKERETTVRDKSRECSPNVCWLCGYDHVTFVQFLVLIRTRACMKRIREWGESEFIWVASPAWTVYSRHPNDLGSIPCMNRCPPCLNLVLIEFSTHWFSRWKLQIIYVYCKRSVAYPLFALAWIGCYIPFLVA